MIGTYNVYCCERVIGQVVVEIQGMFYVVRCSCQPPENEPYYLWVIWADHQEKLGICAYNGSIYGMVTKINTRKAGEGQCRFELRKRETIERIIHINELSDPLLLLANIPRLRLVSYNGRKGIRIMQDPAEGRRGNGQSR